MAERLKRKDSFFGLHFDIHPRDTDMSLGADCSEEMMARLLDRVKPDYVQYDCKGHVGYCGYPTEVGTSSPGIAKDALEIWRKVTAERDVALYIHYSGVLDGVAIEKHPEWAALDAEGNPYPSGQVTSTFGPYVDELLVPQLREAITKYGLDGAWLDGESWGAELDYSPAALEAWKNLTGLEEAPKSPEDPRWQEWKQFHRDRFEEYLRHWVDSVHETCPDAQLCSNWMYSIAAPRPVNTAVDFLSGDYSPMKSADTGRRQARYLASIGMPWDLMSWGFIAGGDADRVLKLPVQIMQEAGAVLMQGGGFQVYYKPTRSGFVPEYTSDIAGEVAAFCRARQEVSHKSTTVPQVALLFSTATLWERCETPFDPEPAHLFDEMEGMLHALLELHYSVDVLAEHDLAGRLDEFPLVVIPHATVLEEGFKEAVLRYVASGGSLVVVGQECCRLFENELGVSLEEESERQKAFLPVGDRVISVDGQWPGVAPADAEIIVRRYPGFDLRGEGVPAATVASRGKGRIAGVYGPVSMAFRKNHHPFLRTAIGDVVQRVFPHPAVTVDAPADVDIALRRTRDGRLSLHLLNLAGAQRADDFVGVERIPETGPIEICLEVPEGPREVAWVPDGGTLDWEWRDGRLSVTIPSLHIHGVIVVETQGEIAGRD